MLEIKRNKTFCTFSFTITCKEFLLFTPQQKHERAPQSFPHAVIWKRPELGSVFLSQTEVNNSENKSQFLKLKVRCDLHLLVFNISRAGQFASREGKPRGTRRALGTWRAPGARWTQELGSGSKPPLCPSFPSLPNWKLLAQRSQHERTNPCQVPVLRRTPTPTQLHSLRIQLGISPCTENNRKPKKKK